MASQRREDIVRFINEEQRRQMEAHKWLVSEKLGYDVGETGYYDWVEKFAAKFRSWINEYPMECIDCGLCTGVNGLCLNPFDERRKEIIYKKKMKNAR